MTRAAISSPWACSRSLSIIFFIIAFLTTKERIQPDPQQKTSLSQDLSDLFRNRPWIVLFLATLFYFAAIVMRGNVMLPYFRYVAGNVDLFSWFNGFGLASLLLGVACSTAVSKRVGKRQLFIASMILAGVFSAALLVIPPQRARWSSSPPKCCANSPSGCQGPLSGR